MSRFVSGGTNDAPTERDEEWLKAQKEIEAKALQKAELSKQQGGKSLFETLEANKAAKQEAFEESIRLKNQFQTLNEDEVEFLDSVLEETRRKDEAVRRQTREGLEAFKRQQEEAGKSVTETGEVEGEEVSWKVGRKRKKGKEDILGVGGVKVRKSSSVGDKAAGSEGKGSEQSTTAATLDSSKAPQAGKTEDDKSAVHAAETLKTQPPAPPPGLGLAAYSSDEDD